MLNPNVFRIAILTAILLAPFAAAIGQAEVETIDFFGVKIPVNPSDRPLVSGIDVDRLLGQWIPDFSVFQSKKKLNSLYGLTAFYSIPYPEGIDKFNPEDVKKLADPAYYKRTIRIEFGVFPSHKEALHKAIAKYGKKSSTPQVVFEPGFVSVGLWEGMGLIVRDNVFVWLVTLHEDVKPYLSVQKIDEAILKGEEGVYRETTLDPPILQSAYLLDNPLVHIENQGALRVHYADSQNRKVQVYCQAAVRNSTEIGGVRSMWDAKNESVVLTGTEGAEGTLHLTAASELGVMAEEIAVNFVIVPTGQADDFTRSSIPSSVEGYPQN